jgi:sulfur carrier protein
MTIWVNGEQTEARGARTVAELAERFELQPNTILIEHNGLALHQREWRERSIGDGDRIEIVRVVAGG